MSGEGYATLWALTVAFKDFVHCKVCGRVFNRNGNNRCPDCKSVQLYPLFDENNFEVDGSRIFTKVN